MIVHSILASMIGRLCCACREPLGLCYSVDVVARFMIESSTKGLFMRITAFSRWVVAGAAVLAGSAAGARAQWIGPGSTPQGDYLRGAGIAAMGMGIYNEKTAIANSINLDTMIRWNEYMAAVANEQRREYVRTPHVPFRTQQRDERED